MGDLAIGNTTDGVVIDVKIIPNSRENKLDSIHDRRLKIRINAAPEDGKANKELVKFLAEIFSCKKSQVKIIRGETAQEKMVLVKDKLLEVIENIIYEKLQ